ncbi:hypothetical protein ColKHC_06873 [Colletotrichum higginsianum]|nr:hypothetical protein ColKHC_06873 [Colletotrichum higginsianum]
MTYTEVGCGPVAKTYNFLVTTTESEKTILGVFNLNKSTNYRNNLNEYRFQLDHFVGGNARRGQHRLSAFGVTSLKRQ